jgi:tetratricopeptide (TPR) repeat protein
MPRKTLLPLVFIFSVTLYSAARPEQGSKPDSQNSKGEAGESSSAKQDDSGDSSSSKPSADSTGPNYDPYHAEQDVEVGNYYMHKGDVDAAIGRFEDAIRLRANFAKPRILLAEAYEKKGDKTTALKYYKEYLQVFPDAPDAKKIRQKIAKLSNR